MAHWSTRGGLIVRRGKGLLACWGKSEKGNQGLAIQSCIDHGVKSCIRRWGTCHAQLARGRRGCLDLRQLGWACQGEVRQSGVENGAARGAVEIEIGSARGAATTEISGAVIEEKGSKGGLGGERRGRGRRETYEDYLRVHGLGNETPNHQVAGLRRTIRGTSAIADQNDDQYLRYLADWYRSQKGTLTGTMNIPHK
ncbi:hypothetical protein AMTR_s00001p00268950 [Amborella trichopoda]|uniref:Uncharacterized protein n=1 Tax=Amborella trichopoda TaxID=13333 RepID=W1NMP6_AMBTC|nr:hypothetical protein AMTR_s00001p00268950 [Amborella trichopoda]